MLLLTVSISTSTSRSSARFLAMALSTAASDRFKLGNFVAIRLNRANAAGLERLCDRGNHQRMRQQSHSHTSTQPHRSHRSHTRARAKQ